MPILKSSESTFKPIPAGSHPARCYGMVSLGTQPTNNPKFKPAFKVVLLFEFPTEEVEFNGEKRPCVTSHFLNAYLGSPAKPSNTSKFLGSWRGRPFTEEELRGFDLSKVVGAPALINIIHETKEGKTRDAIASISPMPKGMTCAAQFHKTVIYEIEDGKNEVYAALPEWMQKMIGQCLEWNQPFGSQEKAEAHSEGVPDDVVDAQLPF